MALKHVYYHVRNESLARFYIGYRMLGAGAQRDDMGRFVGGGFRVGNSCTPVVESSQCMAIPIQYCKVK